MGAAGRGGVERGCQEGHSHENGLAVHLMRRVLCGCRRVDQAATLRAEVDASLLTANLLLCFACIQSRSFRSVASSVAVGSRVITAQPPATGHNTPQCTNAAACYFHCDTHPGRGVSQRKGCASARAGASAVPDRQPEPGTWHLVHFDLLPYRPTPAYPGIMCHVW